MTAPRHSTRIRLAAVSALGLTLALVPFSAPFATGDSIIASAYAKGGGGGGGGGNGNGNGNGNGAAASNGNANSQDKAGNAANEDSGKNGLGKSGAPGRAGRSDNDKSESATKGAVSADLGKLNAAHASPTALSRAAPNSTPGMLGAYRDAVVAGMTPAEAEKALGDISNKSVNRDVVNAVNDLLGVSFSSPPAQTN